MASEPASEVIAIGADHAGFPLKAALIEDLRGRGFEILDLGTDSKDSVDYPLYGEAMARALREGRARRGVLICGTGIGMGIAANRHKGVRAATCHDPEVARLARAHNDANVLVLGGRVTDPETAGKCLQAFLDTEFEGGRHQRRVAMLG